MHPKLESIDLLPVDHLFAQHLLKPFPHTSQENAHFLAYLLAMAREGHLCITLEGEETLERGAQTLPQALLGKVIICDKNRWYLKRNWDCEQGLIAHWKRLSSHKPSLSLDLPLVRKHLPHNLEVEQKDAIIHALTESVTLICGGPGTGKTFVISLLVNAFLEQHQAEIVLAAPTGKATANLRHKVTSGTTKTLHALLYRKSLLTADLIIVDEGSMIDAQLMHRLFSAIKPGARLILLGDPFQLPPVESGHVFMDLASSEEKHKVFLRKCHRIQMQEVYHLAEKIKVGEEIPHLPLPEIMPFVDTTYKLFCFDISEKTWEILFLHYQRFRLLSPLRRGPYGSEALNALFYQKCMQEGQTPIPLLITANDMKKNLYNGDVGFLFPEEERVLFEGERFFPLSLLPCYEYAYVLSVHKSQGSEYEEVGILVPEGAECFGREILYTAVTRARQQVQIYAEETTLKKILEKRQKRLSGLRIC